MKRFFTSLAGIIVLILLIIVIVLFIGWSRVPDIVANRISKELKVYVDIGSIHLGWGNISVRKIEVGNPPGAVQAQSFKCGEINVQAPLSQYFKNQITIEQIELNNVYLDLEFDSASGTQGNWSRIMGNLQQASAKKQKPPSKTAKQAPATSVLIRKLVLNNIDVDVVYIKEGGKVIHLPHIDQIVLYDISSEGGLPVDQIMNSVLGQMLTSIFTKQNLKNMMQNLIQNPPSAIQKLNPFKGLLP
ncbi:MAG TPA: AsmA family protein [Rhabdochlamydiaceae bacterium]|jgi:uncharacterized protein involved in outer membrane biogenesis